MAACLAGACPIPADKTFPMMTSFIWDLSVPVSSTTALIAIAPSFGANTDDKLP